MKKIWFPIQKSCKKSIFICVVLIFFAGYSDKALSKRNHVSANEFRIATGKKYNEALLYLLSNKWMADTIAAYNIDPYFAYAVVFPELVRYSRIRDKMEVTSLFSLYIQYGEDYANFSVGHFQMKPSFAKKLEFDALKTGILSQNINEKLGLDADSESRLARVKRLDNPLWQVRYLITFIKVMDNMYAFNKWSSTEEKLMFYATAYNFGYWQPEKIIQKQIEKKLFYTSLIPGNRYCYADISLGFYLIFNCNL